ncbi:syntaxin 5 [Angomonas deanei]|nr:syntaxin 5 [Angomonas deanei]|eukprot:EPY40618.1 syntaxin 5 [Angomonas deanei]
MVVERDRSKEFYDLFDTFKSQQTVPSTSLRSSVTSSNEVQSFNQYARNVAADIVSVSDVIMRLTKLTQQQSIFDDKSREMSHLTSTIKSSLQKLHDSMDTLEALKKAANPQKDVFARGAKGSQKHNDTVVDTLKMKLASTGQVFRAALQSQTKQVRDSSNRRFQFTSNDEPQTFESALFQDREQQQTLLSTNTNTQYYRQRVQAVKELEAAVAEVGEMFNDFTRLTHEQEETILRIDADVDQVFRTSTRGPRTHTLFVKHQL